MICAGRTVRHLLAIAGLCACLSAPALAQDSPLPPLTPYGADGEDLVLELGGGALARPAYEGSDEYVVLPWPLVQLHYLSLPGLFTYGNRGDQGLQLAPSFRYVPERSDDDYDELDGLDDVDGAVEIGGTIAYRHEAFRGFVALRRGFGGHDGLVGELGADVILQPAARLSFTFGPRLNFASAEYMDEYFSVSDEEAARSDFSAFDADGGLKGVEVEAEARYALTPSWSLVGSAGYERLVGDAADSPITEEGSENQFSAGLGVTYRFGLDLFQ